jgi:hypothetical protein
MDRCDGRERAADDDQLQAYLHDEPRFPMRPEEYFNRGLSVQLTSSQ